MQHQWAAYPCAKLWTAQEQHLASFVLHGSLFFWSDFSFFKGENNGFLLVWDDFLTCVFQQGKQSIRRNDINIWLSIQDMPFITKSKIIPRGSGMVQWWEPSPPTNVSRFRFPDPVSYAGWVCCLFSTLLREVFHQVIQFSPLLKNQHFQIPIRSWIAWTSLYEFLNSLVLCGKTNYFTSLLKCLKWHQLIIILTP